MAAVSRLEVELNMDSSDFDRGMKHVKKEAGALKKFFGTALAATGGFLAANVIGKGFGLITDNIGSTIDAASDLNESMSATRTVFGDAAGDVAGFSGSVASSLGLSRQEALATATTFGAMGKQIGLTGGELADFSNQSLQAGADLASFYNVPVPEALAAIQSGLQGEYEPLRKFGIFLSDAELNSYAMAKGINKSTQEMTEQEKIALRQQYVLDHLGDAQGDFARTSGGLANQQRILRARLDDLRASIGQKLLPVMLKITDAANRFLARFDKKRLAGIPVFKALLSSLHTTLNQTFGRETGTKIYNTVRAIIDGIKVAAQVVKTAVAVIVDVVRGLISVFQWAQDHFPNFFDAVEQTVRQTIVVIQDVVALIDAIADGDWARAWETFKTLAEDSVQLMIDRLMTLPALLKDIFNLATQAIRDVDWGAVAAFLLAQGLALGTAIVDGIRDGVESRFGGLISWIRSAIRLFITAVKLILGIDSPSRVFRDIGIDIVNGLYEGLLAAWDKVQTFFERLPGRVARYIGDVGTRLFGKGKQLIQGLYDGILAAWDEVETWFGGIGFAILGAVPSLSTTLWQKGRNLIRGLWNGMKEVWNTVTSFFANIGDTIAGILNGVNWGLVEKAFEPLTSLIGRIIGGFDKIKGFIGGGGGGGGTSGDAETGGQAVEIGSFEGSQALKDIQAWTGEVAAAFAIVEPYLIFTSGSGGGATTTKTMQAPPFRGEGALNAVERFAKDVIQQFKTLNLATAEQMRAMKANADIQFAAIATTATTRAFSLRNGVVNQFIGMRTDTVSIATGMKHQVVDQFASMEARAGGRGEGETNALKVSVRNAFEAMRDNAVSTASSIKVGVVGQFSSMLSGVRSVMGQVSGAVSGGIWSARDAANAAASSFYFVGQNIAVGIRNGIRDTAGIIAAAAAGAVNNAINAANQAAQISSPSRRTMYTGAMIAEGMAVGINRGVPAVASAGNRLANAAFVVPGSAGGGSAYGGGGARGGIVNYGTIGIEDPDPRRIRDATHATMVGLARS